MSDNWRDSILSQFPPQAARLTTAYDPDGLVLEEGVQRGIRERGYEIAVYDEPIAFRYRYEADYRARWDAGESISLVVVWSDRPGPRRLPFDMERVARRLTFHLSEFFPELNYTVISALPLSDMDAVEEARHKFRPGTLSDSGTKDFILRHVFGVAAEMIDRPSELLRILLQRHYSGREVPQVIDEFLLSILRKRREFGDWPLEVILRDRSAFFEFLQNAWPKFLESGQGTVPFGHDEIRGWIEKLFAEGLLQPLHWPHAVPTSSAWARVGVDTYADQTAGRRWETLCGTVEETLPAANARYQDWLLFAARWAHLWNVFYDARPSPPPAWAERWNGIGDRVERVFTDWMMERYQGLFNQAAAKPVMVHHIPRFMARLMELPRRKVALVIVDGMSFPQWSVIRDELIKQRPNMRFREDGVFAWVPTVTSVSRQALFGGRAPFLFPGSAATLDKEAGLWQQFWSDAGIPSPAVLFAKGLGQPEGLPNLDDALSHPQLRVAGLVVDKVDKIVHGMELGAAGLRQQTQLWAEQGYLLKLFDILERHGFEMILSSDHGNIEAMGIGRPGERSLADMRGERVRIYPDAALRAVVKGRFPDAIEWPQVGLPPQFLPLIASSRTAFIPEGNVTVAHGGISIDEVIVPFVQVEVGSADA